jgi:hypothetical protein
MADAAPPPRPLPEDMAALRQRVAQLEAALTAQQHSEQVLRAAKEAAEQIVETVREPLLQRHFCALPIYSPVASRVCGRKRHGKVFFTRP